MGVPIWLWNWVKGFLSNRRQRVKYRNNYSQWQTISSGIPQGTKFGPIGFNVLVNLMVADIKIVKDSTLLEKLRNSENSVMATRGQALSDWAKEHKMLLNAMKTVEMRISFKKIFKNGLLFLLMVQLSNRLEPPKY